MGAGGARVKENGVRAWLDADPEELLDEVILAKELSGEGIGSGAAARERVLREIREAQAGVRDATEEGPDGRLLVHRAVALTPEALEGLSAGDEIGICWAFERRGAYSYDARPGRPVYVVSAWVEPGDVAGAFALAMWSSGEGEARLDRRAEVEVAGIVDAAGGPVREDLVGAVLGAGEPVPPPRALR